MWQLSEAVGTAISCDPETGRLLVPDDPIVPFFEGDGTGPDIWRATVRVIDAAVHEAFGGTRRIAWLEVLAGEKARDLTGEWLPDATLEALRRYRVALKGPLTTPVGGGYRSLNVTVRQLMDLYATVRPVRHFAGVPSPVWRPEGLNVVIFRETTEDVYAGIEWHAGSEQALRLIDFLRTEMGSTIRIDSGIGLKPTSAFATKRLVRLALQFALDNDRKVVTLVHSGDAMRATDGAFCDWGYEVASTELAGRVVRREDADAGAATAGRVILEDRSIGATFHKLFTEPSACDVLVAPNLIGDYLSDTCAAQVGGLGMAPGATIGDGFAIFEATHGTAPKYSNQDRVNPGSLMLSGAFMLRYLGWGRAADLIEAAFERTIRRKQVTYDLERQMEGATLLRTSQFADAVIEQMRIGETDSP